MSKPIVMAVDDDPEVLRAVERDLRRHYAEHYRVMRADSGASALNALQGLKQRNSPVSLVLSDQRMPQMTGVEFISRAMDVYPDAKRALLTAYADTDAAIRAINQVKIHHYLLKPWDPPEQELYPVVDDLLDDWQANFRPPFEGVRVLGNRWSPRSYELRDFLARHHIPYQWLDIESGDREPEVKRLIESLDDAQHRLPLVLFSDGTQLGQPTSSEL